MTAAMTSFAVRSSSGIGIVSGPPKYESVDKFAAETSKSCRTMVFSPDGKFFAWANGVHVKVVQTDNWNVVCELPRPKTLCIAFSPKGTYLMTWEAFNVGKSNPQGSPNLFIYKTDTWEVLTSIIHKTQITWEPQWSSDEVVCARMVNNDVAFYENANFDKVVHRINFAKIGAFSVGPSPAPYHVLCYTPGVKGQPALGRMYRYPKFDNSSFLANKSFFQADRVDFYWNNKGNSALLMTNTEVDKTGASYYGKQTLHYMASNGNTAMVTFSKEGPIYSVAWSPKGNEFIAVYGFMPSKATMFNLKCEPVFEFGTAPRNVIHFNPQGNIVLLAGFGNLQGQVQLWDVEKRQLINKCEAPDTTLLQWCPDGTHFLTATTAPRLRIGNGYKIWHYSGTLLHETLWNKQELYDIVWRHEVTGKFKEPQINTEKVEGITASQPQASKQAYRPPGARGRPAPTFNLHDDEPTVQPPEKVLSKTALKQKKKREAKKAKKLEAGGKESDTEECGDTNENKVKSNIVVTLTGDPEKDKKIKNLKKKLDAISKLKEQQASGKTLEINQLAKIKGEEELLQELKKLQL